MLALRRLAELLPPDQPVYGLQVHGSSEQGADTRTISSLGQDVFRRIRAIQPVGPITMIGHSAGGLIAFEAAREFLEAGDPEPRILLMDAVLPHSTFGYYWAQLVLGWRELIGERIRLFRTSWRRRSHSEDAAANDDLMALAEASATSIDFLIRRYRAQAYMGNITVMRTRQGRMMAFGRKGLGWSSIAKGAFRLIDVPGTHMSMLDAPYLHFVAEKITDWLSSE
jgi:thioesterase domain-containing protein